jgi:hypothetical protein
VGCHELHAMPSSLNLKDSDDFISISNFEYYQLHLKDFQTRLTVPKMTIESVYK